MPPSHVRLRDSGSEMFAGIRLNLLVVYVPVYFQAVKLQSPIHSGVSFLGLALSIATGALGTLTRPSCWPYPVDASISRWSIRRYQAGEPLVLADCIRCDISVLSIGQTVMRLYCRIEVAGCASLVVIHGHMHSISRLNSGLHTTLVCRSASAVPASVRNGGAYRSIVFRLLVRES